MIVGQEHQYITHNLPFRCAVSCCIKLKVLFFHEAYSGRHGHCLIINKSQAVLQYNHITCSWQIFLFQCKKVAGEDMF
jgi:hypothetical protein